MVQWHNRLEGKPLETASPYHLAQSKVKADHPDYRPCRFFDEDTFAMTSDTQTMTALQSHLQVRGYSDEVTMRGGVYMIPIHDIEKISFRCWKGFEASTDRGGYRYRVKGGARSANSEARDNSWVMVSGTSISWPSALGDAANDIASMVLDSTISMCVKTRGLSVDQRCGLWKVNGARFKGS